MTHRDHDRMFDPMQMPRSHAARQGGLVPDAGDLERRLVANERYDDRSPQEGVAIGWKTANQGVDQTVTSTAYTLVTGTDFPLPLDGVDGAIWLIDFLWRVVIASTGLADTDVYAVALLDFGDGTFRQPENDLTGLHGVVSAFGPEDYAESAGTGVAFNLKPGAVLKIRGGSPLRIGVGVAIGTAGQSAVVQATNVRLNPHCYGKATPYRRAR